MSKSYNRLCGTEPAADQKPLQPFDPQVMELLSALAQKLLKSAQAKAYPDVVTFAFFCRRAHLEGLRKEYENQLNDRLGRGVVFHIAPSNVPMNFAYSWAASLLAGNANIVKASSRDFAQTRIVCQCLQELFDGEFAALAPYGCVVTYPREQQEWTEQFSACCQTRVIWGGDETIRRVREAALPPRSFDVTFADRYSLLCIRPEAVLAMDERELKRMAQDFYNDTYMTDQNACTSPRLVYWVGESEPVKAGQQRFWQAVHDEASGRYPIEPVIAVDKLTAACRCAIDREGACFEKTPDNLIVRVQLTKLEPGYEENRCPGGFFLEYAAPSLDGLLAVVTPKYQTLSYIGFTAEELKQFVKDNRLLGIDRVAPVGHTMDFALTWDGYDLIRTLSRCVGAL